MGLPVSWVVADIFRIKDDVLAEHWDVIQNEATNTNPRVDCPCLGTSSRNDLAQRSEALIARLEGLVALQTIERRSPETPHGDHVWW
jgi:hypothetical protein